MVTLLHFWLVLSNTPQKIAALVRGLKILKLHGNLAKKVIPPSCF